MATKTINYVVMKEARPLDQEVQKMAFSLDGEWLGKKLAQEQERAQFIDRSAASIGGWGSCEGPGCKIRFQVLASGKNRKKYCSSRCSKRAARAAKKSA